MLNEEQKAYMRGRIATDTFYLAREILGLTSSDVKIPVKGGEMEAGTKLSGDEYGISRYSPHAQMIALLDRPSLFKHMEAPRGSYKTTVLMVWLLRKMLVDRNIRIFYAMGTEREAKKTCATLKDWLQHPILVELYGDLKGDIWRMDAFSISGKTDASRKRDPTFQVGATDMEQQGVHCDILVGDDLVTAKTSRTSEGLQRVSDYWDSLQHFPVGAAIVIENGTRYNDHDLHSRFLEPPLNEYYDTVVLGCGMELVKNQDGKLVLQGKPIFPFMDEDYLKAKLDSTNEREFSAQYCNLCLPSGLAYYNRQQFQTCDWEDWMSELPAYIVTDMATTTKDDGCFSVIGVVGLDATRRAYLYDLWIGKVLTNEAVNRMIEMFEIWSERVAIHKVLLEETTLTNVFMPYLQERMRTLQMSMPLKGVKRGGNEPSKEQRIERLTGRFEQGRFLVVQTFMPKHYEDHGTKVLWDPVGYRDKDNVSMPDGELVRQFVRYPTYKYRDIPDALADIDGIDKDGNWICQGAGRRRQDRSNRMKERQGTFYKKDTKHGMPRLVEIAKMGQASNDYWGRLSHEIGM